MNPFKPKQEEKEPEKAPEIKKESADGIAVVAIQLGHYGGDRKKPGDKFMIKSMNDFSKTWMKKI